MKTSTKLIITGISVFLILPVVLGLTFKIKIKENDFSVVSATKTKDANLNGELPPFTHIKIISDDKSIRFNINPADTFCYYTSSFNKDDKVDIITEMHNDTLLFKTNFKNSNTGFATVINIVAPDVQYIETNGTVLSVFTGDSNRVFNNLNVRALNLSEVQFNAKSIEEERKRMPTVSNKRYETINLLIDNHSSVNIPGNIAIKNMNVEVSATSKLNVTGDVTVEHLQTKFNDSASITAPSRFFK